MNFYNAKKSKLGFHVNVSFVEGEGKERRFANVPFKIGGNGRYQCQIEGDNVHIVLPLSEPMPKPKEGNMLDDELPF